MAYDKTTWVNGVTPLNADNLNHMEQGIYDNSSGLVALSSEVGQIRSYMGSIASAVVKAANMASVTHAELVSLRDSGNLVTGKQYRITDFVTTTKPSPTYNSAGHPFDIIVVADSGASINEVARALPHEGDTYFQHCNLSAWELKYCLDNDSSRFEWADEENGKGVIWWMRDEFGNEAPYDFKNVRYTESGSWENVYTFTSMPTDPDTGIETISDATVADRSVHMNRVYNNKIGQCSSSPSRLPADLFMSDFDDLTAHDNVLGLDCTGNQFGDNCNYNVLGPKSHYNTFEGDCEYNSLGISSFANSFELSCSRNELGLGCNLNSFGEYASDNRLENNVFGSHIGGESTGNVICSGCFNIRICDYSHNNWFGPGCSYIRFADEGEDIGYCCNNTVDSGCAYVDISSYDAVESDDNKLQNVHLHSGIVGTYAERKQVIVSDRNLPYTLDVYPVGSTQLIVE